MIPFLPLSSLEITNQCVVVCHLGRWANPESCAWQVIKGSQDDVGQDLASIFEDLSVNRIDDVGGVCKTFLCDGDSYCAVPPRISGRAAVYSFTPKNRLLAEGLDMARVSSAAGYTLLVMTVQKNDKFGKVWVLCGILRHLVDVRLTYYEDTSSVVDELKESNESEKITVVHVQAPGYEEFTTGLADRVVSQNQYQREVLDQDVR